MHRAVWLFCLLAAPAAAQKPAEKPVPAAAPAPDTVRLRFNWPVGLTARVTAQRVRTRLVEGTADSTTNAATYHLTVRPHARGRLIQFHDWEIPGLAELTNPDVPVEEFVNLQERMAGLMPSLVVDTSGSFVAIERVDAMQREMDALLNAAGGTDSLKPEARELLGRLRSPEMLTAVAESEWNALAGTWIDADLVVGLVYETEYELPFPLFPGVMLPMVQEFSAVARVPCTDRDSVPRCVELESFVYPDADALRAVLDRLMQAAATDTTPQIEDFDMETEIRLIAEPATLIPHRLAVIKRVTVSVPEQGKTTETNQIDSKTTRYEYGTRRP